MAEIPAAKIELLLKALGEARAQNEARIPAEPAPVNTPVKSRPIAMAAREDADVEQALLRLDRTLAQGKPAKTRVPRGTYINVVV